MKKHFKKKYIISILVCILLFLILFFLVGKPKTGTFVIEGNRLITSEEDSEIVYVFDIVNRMMLKFNKEESVGWKSRGQWNVKSGTDGEAYYIYLSDYIAKMIYR